MSVTTIICVCVYVPTAKMVRMLAPRSSPPAAASLGGLQSAAQQVLWCIRWSGANIVESHPRNDQKPSNHSCRTRLEKFGPPGIPGRRVSMDVMAMRRAMCWQAFHWRAASAKNDHPGIGINQWASQASQARKKTQSEQLYLELARHTWWLMQNTRFCQCKKDAAGVQSSTWLSLFLELSQRPIMCWIPCWQADFQGS